MNKILYLFIILNNNLKRHPAEWRMFFKNRVLNWICNGKRHKVCKPVCILAELERRIVLDGSPDSMLYDTPIPFIDLTRNLTHDAGEAPCGTPTHTDPTLNDTQVPFIDLTQNSAHIDSIDDASHHDKGLKVVLISNSLSNIEEILQIIPEDTHVIMVDSLHDNLNTINQQLTELVKSEGRKIGPMSVLSHAEVGMMILGTDRIDMANAYQFQSQMVETGKNFTGAGQIQLFGCSLAGDIRGQNLLKAFSDATHTDVYASTNPTGYGPGKDWTLEYATNPSKEMQKVIDTEQMAALPVDLALPDIHVPPGVSVFANATTPIAGIYIASADTASLTVTVSALHGTVTVQVPATPPGPEPVTYTNANITFTDNLFNINTALTGLKYTPASGYVGADTLRVTAVDQLLDQEGDSKTISITVTASTLGPDIVAPTPAAADQNATTLIPGLSVTDAGIGTGKITVALSVEHGTLSAQIRELIITTPPMNPPEFRIVEVSGARISFGDQLLWVNNSLVGIMYTPTTGFSGADHLVITAVDATTPPVTKIVDINVTAPPPPAHADPIIYVPPVDPTVTANVTSPITGISISDEDIGTTGKLTVTLAVSHGTLTVQVPATTPGTTPTVYTNANVTFTDTLANVNTALAGLKYTPTAGFTGPPIDVLTITAVDESTPTQGHDERMVGITVNAGAKPVIDVPPPVTVSANTPTPIAGISITDADIGPTGQLTVTLFAAHGTLTVQVPATAPGTTPTVYTNANVTFTDTLTNVNTALAGLKYTPTTGYIGTDVNAISITAVDQSLESDAESVAITVNAIVYADPVVHVPGPQSVPENSTLAITGISVTDADIGTTGKLTVTLSVLHGTVTVQVPGTTPTTYTNSIVTFTETLANVNTALAGLLYTPTAKYDGTDTLSITCLLYTSDAADE